jgi:hypothetical protein
MSDFIEMQSYNSPTSIHRLISFDLGKKRTVCNMYVASQQQKQFYRYMGSDSPGTLVFDTTDFAVSIKETDHTREIARRFDFLDKSLEEDQDREIYKLTKKLLLMLFKYITFDICPYIGVTDSGQVIAEWHKINSFKIARLIPLSQKEVVFQGIKDSGTVYAITTNLENLRIQGNKELSPFLE